jgi:hypothetical protein
MEEEVTEEEEDNQDSSDSGLFLLTQLEYPEETK